MSNEATRKEYSIMQVIAKYLRTKYDIGIEYDRVHSFADLLTRHLYARHFQKAPCGQIVSGNRIISILFHLKRAIRKLRLGKIPIRILFIAGDPLDWYSLDSVYQQCAADPRFKTHVIHVGFDFPADNYSSNCTDLFQQKSIHYLDGFQKQLRLDLMNPDMVALSSPYDRFRPDHYAAVNLVRFAKLVYIPYCIESGDKKGEWDKYTFGLDTQKNAWRIFTRSKRTVPKYRKAGVPSRRIVCLGHPRIDQYYSNSSCDLLPEAITSASKGKFKIIYAPHHSLYGWSTFLRYGEQIRRFVDDNEDCYLVFRPHPLLLGALTKSNAMSEEAFRGLFNGERCRLYEGNDYYALFRWSDLLISDASSFLVEYAPTRNPVIYLHREDGVGGLDDSLEEDVLQSCYVAHNADQIRAFVCQVKSGRDPLRNQRDRYQENMSVGVFTGAAGKRIAQYLRDKLA